MNNVEILSLVVTIICLVSFCLVFTFLFRHYYLSNINTNIENAIKQEKNINENTSEEQKTIITINLNNSIDKFMQNNIFTLCEKISDNPLVVKYILNCCLDNESLKNRLESYIKFSVKIINDLENLHIDKDIKHLIELKNKYTELYNDLSSSF